MLFTIKVVTMITMTLSCDDVTMTLSCDDVTMTLSCDDVTMTLNCYEDHNDTNGAVILVKYYTVF